MSSEAPDTRQSLPKAVLVATDFSTCARRALDTALKCRSSASEIIVLHVVDSNLAKRMERLGVIPFADAIAKMRARAEDKLAELAKEYGAGKFETMLVEGLPFAEICKIAKDLACDLVVMGRFGNAPELKDFLFGGTAEKSPARSTPARTLCAVALARLQLSQGRFAARRSGEEASHT